MRMTDAMIAEKQPVHSYPLTIPTAGKTGIIVPGGEFLLMAEYVRKGADLVLVAADGTRILIQDYFATETPPLLQTEAGATIDAALAGRLAGPLAPGQYAQAGGGSGATAIGKVDTANGSVSVKHADGTQGELHKGDNLFEGDVLQTALGGAVGMVFADGTTMSLGEKGRLVLDQLSYEPGNKTGEAHLSVVSGSFALVSGQISKTTLDALQLKTPTMTVGIRGTGLTGNSNTVAMMQEKGGVTGEVVITTSSGQILTLNAPGQAAVISASGGLTSTTLTPLQVMQIGGNAATTLPNAANTLSNSYNTAVQQVQQQIQQQQQEKPEGKPQSILSPVQQEQVLAKAEPLLSVLKNLAPPPGPVGGGFFLKPPPPIDIHNVDPIHLIQVLEDRSGDAFRSAKGLHDAANTANAAAQAQHDQLAGQIAGLKTVIAANSAAIATAQLTGAALPTAVQQVVQNIANLQASIVQQKATTQAAATQATLVAGAFPLARAEADAVVLAANAINGLAADADDAAKLTTSLIIAEALKAAPALAIGYVTPASTAFAAMSAAITAAEATYNQAILTYYNSTHSAWGGTLATFITSGATYDTAKLAAKTSGGVADPYTAGLTSDLATLASGAGDKQALLAALALKVATLQAQATALHLTGADTMIATDFTTALASIATDAGSTSAQTAAMDTAITTLAKVQANPFFYGTTVLADWTSGTAAAVEAAKEVTRTNAEAIVVTDLHNGGNTGLNDLIGQLQTLRTAETTHLDAYQTALGKQSALDLAVAASTALKTNATDASNAWHANIHDAVSIRTDLTGAATDLTEAAALAAGAARDAKITAAGIKIAEAFAWTQSGYNQAVLTYYNNTHEPDLALGTLTGSTLATARTAAEANDFATNSWVVAKLVATTATTALTGLDNSDDVSVAAASVVLSQASSAAVSLNTYYSGLLTTYTTSYDSFHTQADAFRFADLHDAQALYDADEAAITDKQTAIATKLATTLHDMETVGTAKAAEASAEWYLNIAHTVAVSKAETDLATALANAQSFADTAIARAGSPDSIQTDGTNHALDAATAAALAKAAGVDAYALFQANPNYSYINPGLGEPALSAPANKTAAYTDLYNKAFDNDALADSFAAAAATALTTAQTAKTAVQTAITWSTTNNVYSASMADSLTAATAAVANASAAKTAADSSATASQSALDLVIATDPDPAAVASGITALNGATGAANSAALAKLKQEAASESSEAAYQKLQADAAVTQADTAHTKFSVYSAQDAAHVTALNGHWGTAAAAQAAADAAATRASALSAQVQAATTVIGAKTLLGDSTHLVTTTGATVLNANGAYASGAAIATTIAGTASDVSTALYITTVKAALAQTEANAATTSAAAVATSVANAAVSAATAAVTTAATASGLTATDLTDAKTALAAMSLTSNSATTVNTEVASALSNKTATDAQQAIAQTQLTTMTTLAADAAALGGTVSTIAKTIANQRGTAETSLAAATQSAQTATSAYNQALIIATAASARHDALVFSQDALNAAAAAAATAAANAQAQINAAQAARAAAEAQAHTTAGGYASDATTQLGNANLLTYNAGTGTGLDTVAKTYKVAGVAQTSVTVTNAVTAEIQTYLDFWNGNLAKIAGNAALAKSYAAVAQTDFDAAALAGQGFQTAASDVASASTALTKAKSASAIAAALSTTADNLSTAADSWRAGTLISDRIAAHTATTTANTAWTSAKAAADSAAAAAATAQSDTNAPLIAKAAADASLTSQQDSLHGALNKLLGTLGYTPASTALADLVTQVNAYAGTALAANASETLIHDTITTKWTAVPGDLVQGAWHDTYDSSFSAYDNAATAATQADAAATSALARAATLQAQADAAATAFTQAQNNLSTAAATEASTETSEVAGESVAEKQASTLLAEAFTSTNTALTTATTEATEAAAHAATVAVSAS